MPNLAAVERAIGLTAEDAAYINTHRHDVDVLTLLSLLRMQVTQYDPGGFGLLECALDAVRRKAKRANTFCRPERHAKGE